MGDVDGDGLRDADDFCPNGKSGWKSGRVLDLDGDGWEEIVVANGFITQQDSGDL